MPLNALRGVAQGVAGRALKKVTGSIKAGLLGNKKGLSDFSDFYDFSDVFDFSDFFK